MATNPTSPMTPGHRHNHSRGFSFHSQHSSGSGNKSKADTLVESPKDKERRTSLWNPTTKADPNAPLAEQQPAERSLREEFTLPDLRDIHHRDQNGQVIADPDRSNPTRPRMERPLDTIRSFEKAIDNGYKRRSSYVRQADSDQQQQQQGWDQNNQYASRRSSYFGGLDAANGGGHRSNNHGGGQGYYSQQRPDTGHTNSGRPSHLRHNRMQTDPSNSNSNGYNYNGGPQQPRPYPQHGYHQSHDTVNTGMTNGSDSTGPWANGTDPSSDNSSLERPYGHKPGTPGMEGYGQYPGPISEERGYYADEQQQQQQQQYSRGPPPPPAHGGHQSNGGGYSTNGGGAPRRPPIALGGGGPAPSPLPSATRPDDRKNRKSWIKRRFSRD